MPLKLNMTQVLVDFAKFERQVIWKEFWSQEPKEKYQHPIFKTTKTNLPRKHPTPPGLKVFLSSVKSEIMDPENRNKARPNLPPDEIEALSKLIDLQKERKITIKPCDKGAGIIILDFEEYLRSCNKHLQSQQNQPDGSTKPYYQKVETEVFEEVTERITNIVQEGYDNEILSKNENESMLPDNKGIQPIN